EDEPGARQAKAVGRGSIHGDPHDLDADPEWIAFMPETLAEMVIEVPAPLVVEADPQLFLVLRQLDFERFAGWQALLDAGSLGLERQAEGRADVGGRGQR